MNRRRWKAPREHGGLLCEPPPEALLDTARAIRARFATLELLIQGRSLAELREQARREVLQAATLHHERMNLDLHAPAELDTAWIMTGHQPELSHPGVWAKTIAIGAIAAHGGATAVNLIVDDDVPKSASIRVPTGDAFDPHLASVPFLSSITDAPYEDWRLEDPEFFSGFQARVQDCLGPLASDPVIAHYWPQVMLRIDRTDRIGWLLAAGRRALEPELGALVWDVPQSSVCRTEAFAWFLAHILAELPRFQQVHNDALHRYRKANRIRSTHHPVPALKRDHEWMESPFWAWREGDTRRRSLWTRLRGCQSELRLDGEIEPFLALPLCPGRDATLAVAELQALDARGIRLRSRALTTTLFARWFLADLFIHGIGGAKYDELGDEVARGFFGREPSPYGVLSLTVWLGLEVEPRLDERAAELRLQLRRMRWQPERFLMDSADPEIQSLLAEKAEAIAGPTQTRRDRRQRWRRLHDLTARLRGHLAPRIKELEAELAELEDRIRRSGIARSRELPSVVHDHRRLAACFDDLKSHLRLPGGTRSD
jgi:hypothetical protein